MPGTSSSLPRYLAVDSRYKSFNTGTPVPANNTPCLSAGKLKLIREPAMFYRIARYIICLFLFGNSAAFAQNSAANADLDEVFHTVKLSRGTELNIVVSKQRNTAPSTAALLFASYPGVLKIRNEAGNITYDLKGNFLIRARRHLNSDKIFTVMVDCPVDQWSSCDDRYRSSDQHAADVAEVISTLRHNFGAKQAYIIGTSYGTVSSSFLAKNLGDMIDGAIHTATFTDPRPGMNSHGNPMQSFDWSQAKTAQLFVHHRDDPCDRTRYSSIVHRKKDIPLITVEGTVNPRGEACQALTAHGFVGREKAVMMAIGDWIATRKVAALVGDE
jgi:pimeloyl-ACP methyl ester carboxylesterase